MALADRRPGPPGHPACRAMGSAVRRFLLLVGLVAAGWLLGGAATAAADEPPTRDLSAVAGVADSAGQSAERSAERAAERPEEHRDASAESVTPRGSTGDAAADRARHTAQGATGTGAETAADTAGDTARANADADTTSAPDGDDTGPRPAKGGPDRDLPSSVGETSEGAGTAAARVVEETTRETGDTVSGTVRTGREVRDSADDSLRDPSLTGAVSLPRETGDIQGGLEKAITERTSVDSLPGLGSVAADAGAKADDADSGDAAAETVTERPGTPAGANAPDSGDPSGHAGPEGTAAGSGPNADHERQDRTAPSDQSWRGDSGSTGAPSAPWIPQPAAAGFLASRYDAMRLLAQRVALPSDPAVAVRDAADDPSFSPD